LRTDWSSALPQEMQFWEWAIKDGGKNWKTEDWNARTDPNRELENELKELIPAPEGAHVKILDVGSGPLTRFGKKWLGRSVEIVPVDPLAEDYNKLFARLCFKPLVAPIFAHGEKLLDCFPRDHFDLAYASNSLDHSYDPLKAIEEMIAVTKPSHYVYLWHAVNEATRERFSGLHQWNFDIRKGEFVVDDGRQTRSVSAAFSRQAEVSCEFTRFYDVPIVVARLKKFAR
jgi:SAM-dependent methyltransferase